MSRPRQRLTSSVQVNESLLAMSFENEGKEEEEETESDTLNDSDNIDSQNGGSSNKGKHLEADTLVF